MNHIYMRKFALTLASVSFSMFIAVLLLGTTVYGETPETTRGRREKVTPTPTREYPVSCTDLVIEHLCSYDGVFWEDGSGRQVEGVAALMLRNQGEKTIPYAQIGVTTRDGDYVFDATMLPPGGRVLIPERQGKSLGNSEIVSYFGWNTVKPESCGLPLEIVEMTDTAIIIQNTSCNVLSDLKVFYRTYIQEGDFYMGGKAFFATLSELNAHGSAEIQPQNYAPGYSKVVWIEETETMKLP